MNSKPVTAVIVAAGRGVRMHSDVPKVYMPLNGKPMISYSIEAFERSAADEIIIVTGSDHIEYCKNEIVDKYGYSKVTDVIPGGEERYDSVYEGLKRAAGSSYVLIHDGARPCVTEDVINRTIEGAREYGACVAAVPVKDTIKTADHEGYTVETLKRDTLWTIQTPQAFEYQLIFDAYSKMIEEGKETEDITDDAMVIEKMTSHKVRLIEGDYQNIKVTTPEDMDIAGLFLQKILDKNCIST